MTASMLVLMSVAGAAEIVLSDDEPLVEGRAVTVRIEGAAPGTALAVTYRPNSELARTEELVIPADGEVTWVPELPGLVVLTAGDAKRQASVRFAGVPWSGVAVFFVAGALLWGGMGLALTRLMRSRDEGMPLIAPVDT
jgi:hypothetical protein